MRKVKLFLLMLVALLGTVSASAKTVYIQPNANWLQDGARFALYMYGGASDAWTDFAVVDATNNIYKATFDDSQTNMIFCRMNGTTTENNWDNKWNQTGDLDAPANDNQLYVFGDGWDSPTLSITENYTEPVVAGYTVDFNTEINTSSHDFAVAPKWKHIVQDNDGSYVNYKWDAAYGVNGTGGLLVYNQKVGSSSWDMATVYDLLVTPKVSGTIRLKVKVYENASSSTKAFVQLWSLNGTATEKDTQLKEFQTEIPGYNNGTGDWVELTYDVTEGQRIGIRAQYVYIDDFSADAIDTTPEAALVVSSVMDINGNTGTQGTNPVFEEQPDGNMKVVLKVTLSNTGDVDFVAGTTENYTLTVAQAQYGAKTYYDDASIAIPEDLAAGESKTFDVEFTVPYISGYRYWYVRENVTGTTSNSNRYATSVAYEPKFIFRAAESTSTSSLSSAQAYGLIGEETTNHYEIANTGTAPLVIKSITLPEGFTSANIPEIPAEGLSIAKGTTQALDITLPITTMGSFSGNLTIVYLDKNNAEQTYTLAFSGNVLPAGTWAADFNGGNAIAYPAGSIAEGGINSDYQYADGAYNYYIKGRTSSSYASENNKFITPKLHATAGQQLTFDVKGAYGSSYYAKVYVSTDRKTWGDPVAYFTYGETDGAVAIGSSEWVNKAITFDTEGDYYVAFSLYGEFKIDNIIGLTKVDVAHDLYIKSVNWPDASIKSGASQSKPSLDVIPLTDEAAANYTVKYVCGETVLAEGTPVALTASANSSKTFSFSWTPSVESTTVYNGTKVVFEFTDGTKIESETFDLTVTNEPKFHFVKTLPSSKWYEPTDYTTPITFGKTNTADKQNFYVYNWGSAPLTVKSIAVPAGFTATPAEQFTVAAFDENDLSVAAQAVEITFSATEAGTYSGDMVITYVDGTGADATFTLAVSGTKLDPSKWYANFGGESNQWPAGSVYQDNVSTSNIGTYSAPDYAITSSSSTKNMFVTPKLTAVDGDKLAFDAKLYSSYWSEGKVVVYAAATREEVLNAEDGTTRTQLFSVSGQDETNPMTTDYQTFEVPALAGDFFYGFEISGRPYVDELYGLAVANVEHDWTIASSNIPTEAMQNVAATATVNVQNLGLTEEAADSYTATLYVNGEAAATAEAVALPMIHKLSDAGTQLSFSFLTSKVGTFPVYVELKAGDYSVTTEPVDVTFAEEVFVNDAIEIGSGTTTSYTYAPIDFYNFEQARTSDIVYTAEQLTKYGLKDGDKISTLAFKGTLSSAKTMSNSSLRAWVGLKTGDITYGSPDKSAMTEVTVYNAGDMVFVAGTNMVTINLPENITYDGTSDLRIYLEGGGNSEYVGLNFAYDTNYSNMKWSNATSMKYNPLLYVTLDAAPATLAGSVKTSGREAIEGATVTLKAENGVEYTGTTDNEGNYSINVIQAGLDFTATVEAENFLKKEFAYNLGGESKSLNVTLYKSFGIVGGFPGFGWDNDQVMTQSTEDPNIFTVVVPDVELEATQYEYKLRADGIWKDDGNDGYQLPGDGSNNNWVFNLAGTYTLKFTANVSEHTLALEPVFILEKNTDVIANLSEDANLAGVTIASERQFKAGWNAIYLPVYVSAEEVTALFGENAEIAYYAGDESNASGDVTVKFGKRGEGSIEAGVPYLLWSDNAVNGFELTGREIKSDKWSTTGTTFDFVGVYTQTDNSDGDYIVQGGEFRKASTANFVKPFRSYLKLKTGQTARSLNFVVTDGEEGTVTGIDAAKINGLEIEGVYNLNGQKVTNLNRKGLYIINGKKVMVK